MEGRDMNVLYFTGCLATESGKATRRESNATAIARPAQRYIYSTGRHRGRHPLYVISPTPRAGSCMTNGTTHRARTYISDIEFALHGRCDTHMSLPSTLGTYPVCAQDAAPNAFIPDSLNARAIYDLPSLCHPLPHTPLRYIPIL